MGSYAQSFAKEDLELSGKYLTAWTPEGWARNKIAMIVADLKMAAWALTIPRRVGGTDSEGPARDKRSLRQIIHLQRGLLKAWCELLGEEVDVDTDDISAHLRAQGAQLNVRDWTFATERHAELDRDQAATVALQKKELKWANKVVTLYGREISELTRIRNSL